MPPQDSVEEIKSRLDIKDLISEYVRVQKAGINYRALCPFHKEKTPSFFISPTRQLWRCFGCGEGGDVFSFVQAIEGVDFPEALRILAQKTGVTITKSDSRIRTQRTESLTICELTAKYFQHQLQSKHGAFVLSYFRDRGISDQSIATFRLGYAPQNDHSLLRFLEDHKHSFDAIEKAGVALRAPSGEYRGRYRGRIIFPIMQINGDVVGFGARKLDAALAEKMKRIIPDDAAKYINTPQTSLYDKSRILYGLDKAKIALRQEHAAIIVEGYTDVILAHQNGYKNVVAASGTALTEHQLDILQRFSDRLIMAFDMDVAGDHATRRGIQLAQEKGFDVRVILLPKGKDPADVLQSEPRVWKAALKDARSVMQFYFESAFQAHDVKTPEGKREIAKALAQAIRHLASKIEQAHWVQRLATELNVPQEVVWEDIKQASTIELSSPEALHDENASVSHPLLPQRELVSQHILACVARNPQLAKQVITELKPYGIETRPFQMIQKIALKKNQKPEKVLQLFTGEDRLFLDQLLFEAEILYRDAAELTQSFPLLLNRYKALSLETELTELQNQIQQNETQGEVAKNEKLLQQFQEKAQLKAQLS